MKVESSKTLVKEALKEINAEDLYSAMQSDKKKQGKNLNYIVLEKIGKFLFLAANKFIRTLLSSP